VLRSVEGFSFATFVASLALSACSSELAPKSAQPNTAGVMRCDTDSSGCSCGTADDAGCTRKPQPALDAGYAADRAGKPSDVGPKPAERMDPGLVNTGPGTVVAEPMDDAASVFDPTVVHTFDVEIEPTDLEAKDSDPSAERYVPARLHFNDETYEVGYHYQANGGTHSAACRSAIGGAQHSVCSVELSFDWKDPRGRFHGLEKLSFHALGDDRSMMRERLGYALFRAMGVPTSRASHAILRVDGQADLYLLVEEIDGHFTRSRFTEGGNGNLYKEIWPVEADPEPYVAALESAGNQAPSVSRMLRFNRAVFEGPDSMAAWMDGDVTTSYMAVDRVILNDDGAFHFYCYPGAIGNNPKAPGNHNYYWYEAANVDRLWIIPSHLEHSMTDTLQPPHLDVDWRVTPTAADCSPCQSGSLEAGPAAGCDRVIHNFQAWQANYEAKVDRFIAGPFRKAAVDDKLDRWKQQIVEAGFPVEEAAINELKATLDRARMNRGYPY
jgi:hypothetical protein